MGSRPLPSGNCISSKREMYNVPIPMEMPLLSMRVWYEPHVIKRGSHKSGRDLEKQTMEIEFSLLSVFAQNLSRS